MTEPYTPRHFGLIREGEQLAQRAEHYIAEHLHHQPYHAGRPPKGPDMSALLDVKTDIVNVLADVTAKLEHLSASAPQVIDDGATALERLSKSAIVGELEQLVAPLDPALEQAIAAIIRGAGDAAAKVASLTAPPAPAEGEPAPGDPQIQTGIAT